VYRRRGFTRGEFALALAVAGLIAVIVAVILVGRHVLREARYEDFVTDAGRMTDIAAYAVHRLDGRLPGANPGDGLIALNPRADINRMQNLANPRESLRCYGASCFFLFLGNDGARNILAVLPDLEGGAFDRRQVVFLESLDARLDGAVDGARGVVIGVNSAPDAVEASKWLATYGAAPKAADWQAGATRALVYYFDKRP
jgi:hypothetical protein